MIRDLETGVRSAAHSLESLEKGRGGNSVPGLILTSLSTTVSLPFGTDGSQQRIAVICYNRCTLIENSHTKIQLMETHFKIGRFCYLVGLSGSWEGYGLQPEGPVFISEGPTN